MRDVPIGHRSQAQLLGREPERERTRVVLGEHREEPFDGAEERAVDHDRTVALPVVARVMQVETLRELGVHLDRGHLPGPPDRVLGLHRDLGAVERASPLIEHEGQIHRHRRLAQRFRGRVPFLLGADGLLLGLGR